MLRSESVTKVLAAMHAARKQFGPVKKSESNPAYKSRYADLADYIEAIKGGFDAAGLVLTQPTSMDTEGRVAVETMILHAESGEWIGSVYPVVPDRAGMQALGSATSYARRYGLAAILGLASEDDDGNHADGRHNGPQRPQERPQAAPQRPTGPRQPEPAPASVGPRTAAPPKPWKVWVVAAAQHLDIHPQRLINHLGKALAEHVGGPVPEPTLRDAYLAAAYAQRQEARDFLAAECRRYRAKLAAEPAADEADPDPDDDALGSRE